VEKLAASLGVTVLSKSQVKTQMRPDRKIVDVNAADAVI
jgi:hypothetical protein